MAKKIGVIIQGPLVTYGQGPNNSVCGFDTFKTIVENIETIKLLGFEYIVSTWDPVSDLEINIVAQLREAKIDVLICKIPSMTDPDHRYKHHYGIMKGVDHLTACGKIEILINIRTDMIISRVLFNWIIAHIYSYPARMVVSELLKNEAFYIGDFVYAAKTEVIQKFLNNFLHFQSTNLHPSIASDIGIKTLVSNNVSVSFWNKLPIFLTFVRQLYYYNQNIPIWGNIIHNKISALPENLWNRIIWRNNKMIDIANSENFLFYEDLYNSYAYSHKNCLCLIRNYKYEMIKYYKKRINYYIKKCGLLG